MRRKDESIDQLRLGESLDSAQLRRAWREALRQLLPKASVTSRRFLEAIEPLGIHDDCVALRLDSAFGRQWVSHHHRHEITVLLSEYLGREVRVELVGEEASHIPTPMEEVVVAMPAAVAAPSAPPLPAPQFNPQLTFETLIVGQSNRLAVAAGQAVVEAPGKRYNPLFLYGAPGLGKTHLLHAIGQAFLSRYAGARVVYMSAEAFVRDYVQALRSGRIDEFRARYRSVDLWLMDDVQFLAGKERSQEEFFHLYNALYSAGRPLVMSSDKPPRDLSGVEERLRSRFEQGLCADIAPPDYEMRIAILCAKAEREGVALPIEVAEYIADKVHSNVRALEGVLTRLIAHSSLYEAPISLELAREALRDYLIDAPPSAPLTLVSVIEAVCEEFAISEHELTGKSRRGDIVPIRQIAAYMARELTGESWTRIAQALQRNDHTTVMHAYRQIAQRLPRDPQLRETVQRIRSRIQRRQRPL